MKKNDTGKRQLIAALKSHEFAPIYAMHGDESYMKEYYLKQLQSTLVDETFADFNSITFSAKDITPDLLSDALNGYPAMSDKKLVVIRDVEMFKAGSELGQVLLSCLEDWPEYLHLVLYYDTLAFKPLKTTKLYKAIKDVWCEAEFAHLEDRELMAWVQRRVKANGATIDSKLSQYMIFKCGNDMTKLTYEVEKVCAHTTTGEIKQYNIDSVCSPTLEAVAFDLTDAISTGEYAQAIRIFNDLLAQKENEVRLFGTITRHIQRLYAAKITTQKDMQKKSIGSASDFYISKLVRAAKGLSITWLRKAASLCAEMDSALKDSGAENAKQIELFILTLATIA